MISMHISHTTGTHPYNHPGHHPRPETAPNAVTGTHGLKATGTSRQQEKPISEYGTNTLSASNDQQHSLYGQFFLAFKPTLKIALEGGKEITFVTKVYSYGMIPRELMSTLLTDRNLTSTQISETLINTLEKGFLGSWGQVELDNMLRALRKNVGGNCDKRILAALPAGLTVNITLTSVPTAVPASAQSPSVPVAAYFQPPSSTQQEEEEAKRIKKAEDVFRKSFSSIFNMLAHSDDLAVIAGEFRDVDVIDRMKARSVISDRMSTEDSASSLVTSIENYLRASFWNCKAIKSVEKGVGMCERKGVAMAEFNSMLTQLKSAVQ